MEETIYSRGYLPHWDIPGACQFLTWRLYDALDAGQWAAWKEAYGDPEKKQELYRVAELHLDRGLGSALLSRAVAATAVMETLCTYHTTLYWLHAAVVMPNHVHAVVGVESHCQLGEVMRRIKGASSRAVNETLGRQGRLWQPDYFDRIIRSARHFERCVGYVHWNPVKAGLCNDPRHFPASTANDRWAKRTEVRGPNAG